MLVALAVFLPLGMLVRPMRRYHAPFTAWVKEYWVQIAVCFILMAGFLVRVAGIPEYPAGFNQDEASSGYEAYAIMQTGADRNGVANPVHLISWGSGQKDVYKRQLRCRTPSLSMTNTVPSL